MEEKIGNNVIAVEEIVYDFFKFQEIVNDLQSKSLQPGEVFLFRGEAKDYGSTKLTPQLFRKREWIDNENIMLNRYISKFPEVFPTGTSAFDVIIYADHYSLPTRVLDVSYSPLVALYMACSNHDQEDGVVYLFKVKKSEIKFWNSDTVALLSNIAKMESTFNSDYISKSDIGRLLHYVRDERNDFYQMYSDKDIQNYKTELAKIICVESKQINKRIINQQGLFFLFGIDGTKRDFERLKFGSDVVIYQIRIDKSTKNKIIKQLAQYGVDKMTMFPDMQNVCEALREDEYFYSKTKSKDCSRVSMVADRKIFYFW